MYLPVEGGDIACDAQAFIVISAGDFAIRQATLVSLRNTSAHGAKLAPTGLAPLSSRMRREMLTTIHQNNRRSN